MKFKKHIIIKIPIGIDADIKFRVAIDPPNFKWNLDNFMYIIGKIAKIPINNKKLENMRMMPISSEIMRNEIGKDYKKYINWLIKNGFLISDYWYIPGKLNKGRAKCICYGYSKKYYKSKWCNYKITKRSLLKREMIWNSKFLNNKGDMVLNGLSESLKRLQFDFDGAVEKMDEMFKSGRLTQRKYDIQLDRCEKIKNKDFYMIRCEYGRIHTNFTSLMKELREFVKDSSGDMVGLDIKNCQPALLYALIKKELDLFTDLINNPLGFYVDYENIKDFSSDIREKYIGNGNYIDGNKKISLEYRISFNKIFDIKDNNNPLELLKQELINYSDALSLDIYNYFMNIFKEEFGLLFDRVDVKKMFFSFIFGKDRRETPMYKIFSKKFPYMYKIIKWIKSTDYKNLAQLLQKKESSIVIDTLCKDMISEERASFYTIHDAIYIPVNIKEKIYNKFNEILIKNGIITGLV